MLSSKCFYSPIDVLVLDHVLSMEPRIGGHMQGGKRKLSN